MQISETFYFKNYDSIRELYGLMHPSTCWPDNLLRLVTFTQERWVGEEHGSARVVSCMSEERTNAVRDVLRSMRLYDEVLPPQSFSSATQLVILGGFMESMLVRLRFAKYLLDKRKCVPSGAIIMLAGQRIREDHEASNIADLMASDGRYQGLEMPVDAWFAEKVELPWASGINPWLRSFATETDLCRLAVHKIFRSCELITEHPVPKFEATLPGIPARDVMAYQYHLPSYPDLFVVNARAVLRRGKSRHTTQSSLREWLDFFAPPMNSKVIVISNNPHIPRLAQEVHHVLREFGRNDVSAVCCGAGAAVETSVDLVIGELGRLLFNDFVSLECHGTKT